MYYVVGSGPAGVAGAHALVLQGFDVTMLDVGVDLEIERQIAVSGLGANEPEAWDPKQVQQLIGMHASMTGIPQKLAYGSDYPYRGAKEHTIFASDGTHPILSFALGGLSTVWGAGMLPFAESDFDSWPISSSDLSPHYRSVLEFVDLAAEQDDFAQLYPLYTERYHRLRPGAQTQVLLKCMEQNRQRLHENGFTFGRSWMAVNESGAKGKHPCAYCGLCMYGCPYRLIYNSAETVRELQSYSNFHYQPGVIVKKVIEGQNDVTIVGQRRSERGDVNFRARRVFLASGVYATTQILLESLGAYDQPISMLDSHYFFMPALMLRGGKAVTQERLYTLGQLYIHMHDPQNSNRDAHLTLYTYNDLYREVIKNLLGPAFPLLSYAVDELLNRLIILQGFLNSQVSQGAHLALSRGRDTESKLVVLARPDVQTHQIIKQIARRLWQNRQSLGFIPLLPSLRIGVPGQSIHTGGTFPMHRSPGPFQSDILGRPIGYQRVHAIDATVFPTIPASNIAFTIMANAHRIATQVGQLEV